MKEPVVKTGGLVDFKENIVFEDYKDKCIDGTRNFKKDIVKKYGFIPSSALYRKIINHQIKTYGRSLSNSSVIEFVPDVRNKDPKRRRNRAYHADNKHSLDYFIERNSK